MRGFLAALLLFASAASAEYQAYRYQATIRVPQAEVKRVSGSCETVWALKTEKVRGYLVTVCCYPCSASFRQVLPVLDVRHRVT